MLLNPQKSSFILFSKSKQNFTTRLEIEDRTIDRKSEVKICGIWLSEDLSWSKNCDELCRKAYARIPMISRLKYIGTKIEDLIQIYCLYVRSILEYCSIVFHSSLTRDQPEQLEAVQKVALFCILGENYVSHSAALEMTGLSLLSERREKREEMFIRRCLTHPKHSRLFPRKHVDSDRAVRSREPFQVNHARTEFYRKSAIVNCQNKANAMVAAGKLHI